MPSQARRLAAEAPLRRSSPRPQQVDRHEHVARLGRARLAERIGQHQRADAHQFTPRVEQAGAAVVGARRRSEQGVVDTVLPVACEHAARDQSRGAQLARGLAADDQQVVLRRHGARAAERGRRNGQRRQRLQQAEAGGQVVAHHARRQVAAVVEHQLHLIGLEDQVADRQHQPVRGDHHTRALAKPTQRAVRTRVGHRQRLHADHGVGRAFEGPRLGFEFGRGARRRRGGQGRAARCGAEEGNQPGLHRTPPASTGCGRKRAAAMGATASGPLRCQRRRLPKGAWPRQ
jgi:hypothetical protein